MIERAKRCCRVGRLSLLLAAGLLTAACGGDITVEEEKALQEALAASGPPLLYAAIQAPSSLQGYRVDPGSGALTEVAGSPWTVDASPADIAVDPTGTHLYVTGNVSSSISTFRIDRQSGALTQVGGPVATFDDPFGIAVHPGGGFVFVSLTGSNFVEIFSRNSSSGALTSLGLSPGLPGSLARRMAVHPSGAFLYVSVSAGNQLQIFSINQGSGALTPAGTVSVSSPYGLRIDPAGNFLYSGSQVSSAVSAFSIHLGTGALTALAPPSYPTSGSTRALAFDSTGTVLIASEVGNDTVFPFLFNSGTGALTGVTDFTSNNDPIAIEPCGPFIHVANETASSITGFHLDPGTGVLTDTAQADIITNGNLFDIHAVGCN